MNNQIVPEVYFFLSAIGLGILLSACYDQLRVFRAVLHHSTAMVDAEDILFFLTAGLGFFGLLYLRNEGSMRWFAFAGCGLGTMLYGKTLSRPLRFLEERLIGFVLLPLRLLLGFIRKVLQKCGKQIKIKHRKLRQKHKLRKVSGDEKNEAKQRARKKKTKEKKRD